jgi:CobQ-like glutamine amidotransferase family enzyme
VRTRIALVYPELLGTYGDAGNAEVLAARLVWRGLDVEVVSVAAGTAVPGDCQLYVLGGGEDEPQTLAGAGLASSPAFRDAVHAGAVVLAVCAGFQLVGSSFPGIGGALTPGLGLIDVETVRVPGAARAVGDLVVSGSLGVLTGYENHAGRTRALPGAVGRPLGSVVRGVGNGFDDAAEGWVAPVGEGLVVGTYLHGPVLPQNPALADHLLTRALGHELAALDPEPSRELVAARRRQLGV